MTQLLLGWLSKESVLLTLETHLSKVFLLGWQSKEKILLTLETHLSKHHYQGLSENFLKYSGLQTLALLSLNSAHILI